MMHRISAFLAAIFLTLVLAGCGTTKVVMDGADRVAVSISSSKYTLESDGTIFSVRENNKTVLRGILLDEKKYFENVLAAKAAPNLTIYEEDGFFLHYTRQGQMGMEQDWLFPVKDSAAYVYLSTPLPKARAEEIFKSLSFAKEKS